MHSAPRGGNVVKVAIADDAALLRQGLARLVQDAGCDVVAAVDNAGQLLREVALKRPDAVIVDIKMPPTYTDEGLVAARTIRRDHPRTTVLVLSQYLESEWAMRLVTEVPAGVGYLLKDRVSDVAVIVDALRRLAVGECVIDPTIVSTLLRKPRDRGPLDGLSERERDVLALMAEGRSNAAIAERLAISPRTLEAHIRQVFQKLDIAESPDDHRRVLAVLRYLRER
jgi:DNA-binding NarL/FixJ family response regulator